MLPLRGPLTHPAHPLINVFQPSLGREELDAVARVFTSNWIGKGGLTDRFETEFAAHLGVHRPQIRSINCCTEGLFQSMPLLGIGAGDEVVLPSISFLGAAHAVVAAGATPVFCDVDPRTLNPTAEHLAATITQRTRAVLILHYGGVPCDMDDICRLVDAEGLALIEDSACSVASLYRDRPCGTFGDIGLWSFGPVKIVATGDGGMIYCRNQQMTAQLDRLVFLGLASESGFSSRARDRWWELEVSCVGRRAVTNDIASAIGLEQLKKLPAFINRRRQIHERYDCELGSIAWLRTPPAPPAHAQSSYYMYWIQTTPALRNRLAAFLRTEGIYTTFRYYPLHRVPLFASTAALPHADCAADSTLCIPLHQSLSETDATRVIEAIHEFGRTV